ncbi:SDR family NAD(P)-dependent oxidoreductase [Microbacterium enclense]|uniref:SDR family NAD(P)-dependent oxidoreductase n=1 Tax=Microbacterium enclense TaxID=993073 RepID=A0A443JS81_9MICO|nr:NAD(P)H-binding protein [Microbacterium enclense]RWR23341.1 SDR family NAD(P)-dependent oxidoreductase [Microbacterium enclense]
MITITGATGALNGRTADLLLGDLDPSELTVVVRDPARAARFAEAGVTVLEGRYEDPAGLRHAFEGADRLLLVSSSDPAADAVALHRGAIEAAVAAGVGHILYTSHQGAHAASPFPPARDHAATEEILAASAVPWTSLRNGFYAHSLPWLLGPWRETGMVSVPADGPVSWTSRDDAAEAAAVLLRSAALPTGPLTLTATDAPLFASVTARLAAARGQDIGFEIVDSEDWVRAWVDAGQPEGRARFSLGVFQAAAQGLFGDTAPALRDLLGREPASVSEVVESLVERAA